MIDLLPEDQKKNVLREYRYRKYAVIFFCLFVVALITLLLFIPSYILAVYKNNDANARFNVKPVETAVGTETSLKHEIDNANLDLTILGETGTTTPVLSEMISMISKDKTADNVVTSISYSVLDNGKIKVDVSGVAKSRDSLSAFANLLSLEKGIAKVDIPISNFAKDTDISFSFSINSK